MSCDKALLCEAEMEVAELLAWLASARAAADLARIPRDVNSIAQAMCPAAIEYVKGVTEEKLRMLVNERHRAQVSDAELKVDGRVDGRLFVGRQRVIMIVDTTYRELRARFTVAHEIAHLWLEYIKRSLAGGKSLCSGRFVRVPCDGSRFDNAPESGSPRERLADVMASVLLMPAEETCALFERERQTQDNCLWDVAGAIGSRFQASRWAAGWRLNDLRLISDEEFAVLRKQIIAQLRELAS